MEAAFGSVAFSGPVEARPQFPCAVELEVAEEWGTEQQQQERRPFVPSPPPMEASLTCAVCLSLLEEPVTLPLCSHNFCRGCVMECLALAEASRLRQLQRSPGQARVGRGAPGPGPGPSCARVPCPLCRKLSLLPRGGVAALPVNTTLAEVVRLYRSGAAGAATAGEAALGPKPGSDPLSLQGFGGSCQKHPSRPVQLYCRMCRQAGCGQCVSEEHQGIFHSVNLIDTVYQEEKVSAALSLRSRGLAGRSGWPLEIAAGTGCFYSETQEKPRRGGQERGRGLVLLCGTKEVFVDCRVVPFRAAVRLHPTHAGEQAVLR